MLLSGDKTAVGGDPCRSRVQVDGEDLPCVIAYRLNNDVSGFGRHQRNPFLKQEVAYFLPRMIVLIVIVC
jgi:hypothetical protein